MLFQRLSLTYVLYINSLKYNIPLHLCRTLYIKKNASALMTLTDL